MNKQCALPLLIASAVLIFSQVVQADESARKVGAPFSFALIGDLPYPRTTSDLSLQQFGKLIDSINRDSSVKFVMHTGDIKAGSERCDDSLIKSRFDLFQKFRTAFIFTPGDNDWTDCHRPNNGRYNPLERLDFLRHTFFPTPKKSTGRRPISVIPQSMAHKATFAKYVENVLFVRNRVVFSTVHVVGSNNNLDPWSGIDLSDSYDNPRVDRIAEFQEREQAAIAWLEYTFATAEAENAAGVFILMQANPRFNLPVSDLQRTGFNQFLDKLAKLSQQYGKSVVLAQGDDHVFIVDKPFYTDTSPVNPAVRLPYFTRVQTFGDTRSQWIKVNVNPKSFPVFSFQEKIVNP
jgi:hypothetical protein